MTRAYSASLARNFENHRHLWLALSHFLPADHVNELAETLVRAASGDKLKMDELAEVELIGTGSFASWIVRLGPVDGQLAHFLQNLLRAMAWQNDTNLYAPLEGADDEDRDSVRLIELAWSLGQMDLVSYAGWEREAGIVPEGLRPLAQAIAIIAAEPKRPETWSKQVNSLTRELPPAVRATLIKHLGDLCADQDEVESAIVLYREAETLAKLCVRTAWESLGFGIADMARQSLAEMFRVVEGEAAAVRELAGAQAARHDDLQSVIGINGPLDLMRARLKLGVDLDFTDRRPAVLVAPQLYVASSLDHALEYARDRKFRDSNRHFWATLRRRVARGTATLSTEAMVYFGRSLLAELKAEIGSQIRKDGFNMAVRLLVMSGRFESIGSESEDTDLIATYVDADVATNLIAMARRYAGAMDERTLVVIALFERWLKALPASQEELALALIDFLAATAGEAPWSPRTDRDLARAAFKALDQVANSRPEYAMLGSHPVTLAIVKRLESPDVLLRMSALETASAFEEGLVEDDLKMLLAKVAGLLEPVASANGDWSIFRPALGVLSSSSARRLWRQDQELGQRSATLIARFGLEAPSEATRLLSLLQDIEPFLEQPPVTDDRFKAVIARLRERSGEIRNSAVTVDIIGLFLVPELSGAEGIEDGVKGLIAILQTANSNRPSFNAAYAYDPLIVLTNKLDSIREQFPGETFDTKIRNPLQYALEGFWREGAKKPELFASFSIPPKTRPDAVIVHNWAFATIGFARAVGAQDVFSKLLEKARENNELRTSIDVGRAARLTAGDAEMFRLEDITSEQAEAFYAAIGSRLALLAGNPDLERSNVLEALLTQCLRLGPDELDAAVFSVALALRQPLSAPDVLIDAYVTRLSANRLLQRALRPLLDELRRTDRA